MPPLVELSRVSVKLAGNTVLRDVTLCLRAGDCISVSGPNGSGKTTLLRAVMGLAPAAGGLVRLNGAAVRRWRPCVSRIVAYVPQVIEVDARLPISAFEVAMTGQLPFLPLLHRPRMEQVDRVLSAMEALNVRQVADEPFGLLSGGQRQKVLIARALAQPSAVLLLDEPTNSLDKHAVVNLQRTLESARADEKKAIIFVSHDATFSRNIATALYDIDGGRLVPAVFPVSREVGT